MLSNRTSIETPEDYRRPNRFHPVILFHDDKQGQRSIRYGDPYYRPMIQIKKEQMDQMLKKNSQQWRRHILQPTTSSPSSSSVAPELMQGGVANNLVSCLLLPTVSSPGTTLDPTIPTSSTSTTSSSSFSSTSSISPASFSPPYSHHRSQSLSQHSQDCYNEKKCSVNSNSNSNSNNSRKRRRGNLPKAVTFILKQWLTDHYQHPYPTEEEKVALRQRTGLTLNQISNWFINARRRILPLIIVTSAPSSALQYLHEEEEDLNDNVRQFVARASPMVPREKKLRS